MTYAITPQEPVGSPFGHDSTAAEVLSGIDLGGKLALVTGGYSGIGLELTRALVAAGAEVVVPARRPETAAEALDGTDGVTVGELDLADQESVRSFAEGLLRTERVQDGGIDLVIDNAGVMATPETRVGPGWELQFATNHLGHFALVNRIWAAVNEGARVVAVSSTGHRRSDVRFDDLELRQGYDRWVAYGQSKTANVLFAVHLDRLGADRGVRAFSLHPGGILTPLQRHLPLEDQVELGWVHPDGTPVAGLGFKTPEQGASTTAWAATSPLLGGLGGVFCDDCEVARISTDDAPGVRPYAVDPDSAARLWAVSAELTGVDAFAAR